MEATHAFPGGVWPTMITPFTPDGAIDVGALPHLVQWYISQGVSGLFTVCQSSEMFFLSLAERVRLAEAVVRAADGRIPIIASGHISDSLADQAEELTAMAQTGAAALILVVNRLAKAGESDDVWLLNLEALLARIPKDIPLGLYECPYPYRRLLNGRLLKACARTGRFFFFKDTCGDLPMIREKLSAINGTSLKLYNANTTTLLQSLRDGAYGYSGVMANFHPALYGWLCAHPGDCRAEYLSDNLSIFSLIEGQFYPVNAKYSASLYGVSIDLFTRAKRSEDFRPLFATEVEMMKRLADRLEDEYCPTSK